MIHGVYLKSYEKEIASYTQEGAKIYNLTVENEAIIRKFKMYGCRSRRNETNPYTLDRRVKWRLQAQLQLRKNHKI